jgi:thiamine biosynthesis lipoprotein
VNASASFPALGSNATVCVTRAEALEPACAAVEAVVASIDRACSRFRDDSELVQLNAAAGAPVPVSALLMEAIEVALRAAELTDGLVDPTVGRTLRLAGYDRDFELVGRRAGASFRARFSAVVGWRSIRVDRAAGTVTVPAGVEIDLGATAKALAADRAAQAAGAATGDGVLVSLGGDVAVCGAPPSGWPVRIADDHRKPLDAPGPTVALHTGGLATSGTTVRRWRSGSAELHHIVDPRSGRPADTPWRTVTVAAGSCVDANIASTAALILGADATAWLAARGLPARLVARSGQASQVAGWPAEAA